MQVVSSAIDNSWAQKYLKRRWPRGVKSEWSQDPLAHLGPVLSTKGGPRRAPGHPSQRPDRKSKATDTPSFRTIYRAKGGESLVGHWGSLSACVWGVPQSPGHCWGSQDILPPRCLGLPAYSVEKAGETPQQLGLRHPLRVFSRPGER